MFVFSVIQALILSIPLVVGSSEPPKQGTANDTILSMQTAER